MQSIGGGSMYISREAKTHPSNTAIAPDNDCSSSDSETEIEKDDHFANPAQSSLTTISGDSESKNADDNPNSSVSTLLGPPREQRRSRPSPLVKTKSVARWHGLNTEQMAAARSIFERFVAYRWTIVRPI